MDLTTSRIAQPGIVWRKDDRHGILLAGAIWILIALMIVPEGLDYRILAAGAPPSAGSAVSRILWLSLLSVSALVIWWRAGLAWLTVRTLNPFLTLFVAFAIGSVAWSIDPALSVRRLIRMITILLACLAFVSMGWHAQRFQNVVRPILTVMLLGSIVFGLAFPTLAIHSEAAPELIGAWRGLANHKNGLGALACFALIFWFHAGLTGQAKFARVAVGAAIATACLLLSRSSTSLVATVFVLTLLVLLLRSPPGLRPYVPYAVAALVAVLVVYALAILNLIPGLATLLGPLTAFTDKAVTLTGRTEIWDVVTDHISYHPLLGTGYGAYWTAGPIPGTESYAFMWRMNGFYPGSAHNGYLDIVNDLGLVGLICFLGYAVTHLRHSMRLMGIDRSQGALYLALFFQQAITNLSETHWFSVLSIDFVIMTLASVALARGLLEQRLRIYFGEPQRSANPQIGPLRPVLAPATHRGGVAAT